MFLLTKVAVFTQNALVDREVFGEVIHKVEEVKNSRERTLADNAEK